MTSVLFHSNLARRRFRIDLDVAIMRVKRTSTDSVCPRWRHKKRFVDNGAMIGTTKEKEIGMKTDKFT